MVFCLQDLIASWCLRDGVEGHEKVWSSSIISSWHQWEWWMGLAPAISAFYLLVAFCLSSHLNWAVHSSSSWVATWPKLAPNERLVIGASRSACLAYLGNDEIQKQSCALVRRSASCRRPLYRVKCNGHSRHLSARTVLDDCFPSSPVVMSWLVSCQPLTLFHLSQSHVLAPSSHRRPIRELSLEGRRLSKGQTSGTKKEHRLKLVDPDTFRRGRGLPCEGAGANKVCASKPREDNFLGGSARKVWEVNVCVQLRTLKQKIVPEMLDYLTRLSSQESCRLRQESSESFPS